MVEEYHQNIPHQSFFFRVQVCDVSEPPQLVPDVLAQASLLHARLGALEISSSEFVTRITLLVYLKDLERHPLYTG